MFIKDEEFIRGNCPMTKEDIRILTIGKMNLTEDSFVLDVGSGTGSITVQAAKMAPNGKVLAIEKEDEAFEITKQNVRKFHCNNVKIIKSNASSVLEQLISQNVKLDSVFIGGSSGELEEIIHKTDKLLKVNGTLVLNFITLDNAYKSIEILKTMNYKMDIILINVSKNRGKTLMMVANNPIYIIQCIKEEIE